MPLEEGFKNQVVQFARGLIADGKLTPGAEAIEVLPKGKGFFVSIETECPQKSIDGNLVLIEKISIDGMLICVFMGI